MPPSGVRFPGRQPLALAPVDGPPRIYVPFLWASIGVALTFGATLGALNLARLTGTWGVLSRPSVWAHGYAQLFGFFALFIMGFACHALPRFVEAEPPSRRLAHAILLLHLGGLLCVATGFVVSPEAARAPWLAGSAALVASSTGFLVVVVRTLRTRARPAASFERWTVAGAVWLVAGACLAVVAAARDDVAWHHVLWPVMLYGFVASWILGTGRRLLPISLGWRPRWPWLEAPLFVLYQLGVAAWSIGASPLASDSTLALRAVGAVALLVAFPAVAACFGLAGPRQAWTARGVNRDLARHVLFAWAWLWVGLAAGPLATLLALADGDTGSATLLDFSRHTIGVGFAAQLVIGIGGRFVPAFTGRTVWSARGHRAGFWLLNLGVALRGLEAVMASGLWVGAWPWIALSGPPVLAAFLLFALNLGAALRSPPLQPFRRPYDNRHTRSA